MKEFLKKVLKRIAAFFPTSVPVGVEEFNTWSDSIVQLAGLPNNDSMKFTLASMVLYQLKPADAYVSKFYMARLLKKAAANQVSSYIFQMLKKQQEAAVANENKQ